MYTNKLLDRLIVNTGQIDNFLHCIRITDRNKSIIDQVRRSSTSVLNPHSSLLQQYVRQIPLMNRYQILGLDRIFVDAKHAGATEVDDAVFLDNAHDFADAVELGAWTIVH